MILTAIIYSLIVQCRALFIKQLYKDWLKQIERDVYANLTQNIGDTDDLLTHIYIFNGILIHIQCIVNLANIKKEAIALDMFDKSTETRPIFASLVQSTGKYTSTCNESSDMPDSLHEAIQESRDLWLLSEKIYKKEVIVSS